MHRTVFACSAFLVALAFAACSGKNSTMTANDASNPSPSKPAATDANAPLYPDWARAIAPPYPSTVMGILVNQNLYQFQTVDNRETVAAWYKSHVKGSWDSDATSGTVRTTVNGVQIAISPIPAGTPGTMILISRG